MTVKMSYLALVAKWPTPTAQPSVHYRAATIHWWAQSCRKGLALAAAFEKVSSSGEDECVWVCLQAREQAWKEHSRSEQGSFWFWQKVWILRQSLSPPSKALVCSLSPMLVFGSWLLSSAAEKLSLTLAKERRPWPGAQHPPELEGKMLRCPECIGPVTSTATRLVTGILGSPGNMDTSLAV